LSIALENHLPPPVLPPPVGQPDPGPQDDPFMERLLRAMCQNIPALPGETFVDEARRWVAVLKATASLKPRDQPEWLRAADVTMAQFFAVHSLLMQDFPGISAKQRLKRGQDFVLHTKAMRDARVRYDLLRTSRAA
jgi:hypothetical protein